MPGLAGHHTFTTRADTRPHPTWQLLLLLLYYIGDAASACGSGDGVGGQIHEGETTFFYRLDSLFYPRREIRLYPTRRQRIRKSGANRLFVSFVSKYDACGKFLAIFKYF